MDPCYTRSRSGLIESPYIPAPRTRFVQPGKIEIDANERAVIGKRNAAFSFAPSSILSLTICLDAAKSGFAGQSHLAGVTDSFIKTEANYMELLWDMLPDTLSSRQKNGRINTILTYMRRKNIIKTDSDNHQLSNCRGYAVHAEGLLVEYE